MILFYELLSTLNDEQRDFVADLYEKYRYKIKKIALMYVKNEADADEVLQTVMINISIISQNFNMRMFRALKARL